MSGLRRIDLAGAPLTLDQVWWTDDRIADPINFTDWFGDSQPVEMDVGCGKGLFLFEECQRRPSVNFIGIEWAGKYARFGASRIAKIGKKNVRVITADARRLVPRFPSSSLAAVHIYFPDPWWKTRHKKRRIVETWFISEVARLLIPEGVLWLATDVEEYFGVMEQVLAQFTCFERRNQDPSGGESNRLDVGDSIPYLTHFERKYRLEGRSIHRASYVRIPGSVPMIHGPAEPKPE